MASPKETNLDDLSRAGRDLLDISHPSDAHRAFRRWDSAVAVWLDREYPNSGLSAQWGALPNSQLVMNGSCSTDPVMVVLFQKAVSTRLSWLGKLAQARRLKGPATVTRTTPNPGGKVFLVHGRNEAIRESVARFLEKLGISPVILHEQPNKGRTILEKLIDHSDVAFAVVLLTGDDVGRLPSDPLGAEETRPRQNVILELGFFLGRLGRERACPLYEEGVQLPSDYDGVGFVKLDKEGGWQLKLARELKAASIPIDLNDAL